MVAVPVATGVITPVEALMLAIEVSLEDQEPPDTVEVNVVDELEHTTFVPLNVPAFDNALTETVLVAVAAEHVPEEAMV